MSLILISHRLPVFYESRLINLVAEDNAIEDTIYHLHRALNTGRIDLERFLRVSSAHTIQLPVHARLNSHFFHCHSDHPCNSGRTVYEKSPY